MTSNPSDSEIAIQALGQARRLHDAAAATHEDLMRKAPSDVQGTEKIAAVVRAADRLIRILDPALRAREAHAETQP